MRFEQWRYQVPLLIRAIVRRSTVEGELDEELAFHFEQLIEQHRARGLDEQEALTEARRVFGRAEPHKDACRESWVVAALDRLSRDVRHAVRTLRRSPGFAAGVIFLLAFGIGANVAVFSVVDSVLLKPLPYSDPQRLVVVQERIPPSDPGPRSVNALHFMEWRRCSCFLDVALSEYVERVNMAAHGEPERVSSLRVTPNAFSVLGVSARLGRTFLPEDGEPGHDNAVLISDRLWRMRFGADPNILGQKLVLDAVPSTVVGVLPPGFRYYPASNQPIDIYRPWALVPLAWWTWTNNYSYTAVGRLAPSVSQEATLRELDTIDADIAADHFGTDRGSLSLRAVIVPLHAWVTRSSREGLYLLLAAVGIALLVACLNIANLMLVRAAAEGREAGIRAALGATRLAIFRGAALQSVVLAMAGTAGGVGLAAAALKGFTALGGAGLPRIGEVGLNWPALLAACVLGSGSTVAFGFMPALRLARIDAQEALRGTGRGLTESPGTLRARQTLISVEVGLTVSLLVAAGLLLTSFLRLDAVGRGFDASHVLTAEVGLPFARYDSDEKALRFWDSLLDELRAAPGVIAAGITSSLPLTGSNYGATAVGEGQHPAPADRPSVQYRFVSPGYFDALGIRLVAGRTLRRADEGHTAAVLSLGAARLLWPGRNPLGRRFSRGNPGEFFKVVGLVPDVNSEDLATNPAPLVYAPLTATGGVVFRVSSVAIRTRGEPAAAAGTLRRAVASLDKELAISNIRTMEQIDSASFAERRFQLTLVVAFGAASLLIAALGIYSTLAYSVARRDQELAVRMTLGAQQSRVITMVVIEGLRPVLLGLALGLAAAIVFGRLLANLLYSVKPTDPATIACVVAVTVAAAFLASLLPALRAARRSLLESLKYE